MRQPKVVKEPKASLAEVLRFHWKHALRYRKQVITSFIVGPLSAIADRFISPIFIALLLNSIQSGSATIAGSIWLIIGYATVQFFAFVIGYRLNLYAMWSVQIYGARDITMEAYEAISRHSLGFHNDRFAGSLVSQVNKTSSAFFSFWNTIIFEVMFAVVAIVATLIGTAIISWPLAVVLALLIAIYIFFAYHGSRFMRPRQLARSEAYSKISGQLSDSLSNIVAVKTESKEATERKRLSGHLSSVISAEHEVRRGIITITTVTSLIVAAARIAALVVAVWAVQSHAINAGAVYLMITYTFNLLLEMSNINTTIRAIYQISGDTEEILSIMKTPIGVSDTSKKPLTIRHGVVSIDAISFSHEDGKPLFKDLSITIPAGQKVGIVGVSGSGKTTLTKLLLRLIEPSKGTIKIDGQDITQVTQKSVHDAVAYVPQEPLLFHRSLKENIHYSRPSATDSEIQSAAEKAQAIQFIDLLKDGFDTLVGERGVKLSGGQRQRIAIARAILKDAPVLILDEATSALDSESEQLIQTALEELMQGRTSIVIAHRLSTIAKLDRIIVMEDGKIIEDGTHNSLLKKKGQYAKLWGHQSGGFIEEE